MSTPLTHACFCFPAFPHGHKRDSRLAHSRPRASVVTVSVHSLPQAAPLSSLCRMSSTLYGIKTCLARANAQPNILVFTLRHSRRRLQGLRFAVEEGGVDSLSNAATLVNVPVSNLPIVSYRCVLS
ncbi:hypothetical protein TRVL_07906 [Trypanosoma vivax]|nr:hypothetical protein TRVL_07906 [Trypanosoma vivax]